jgi:hypothetical protein
MTHEDTRQADRVRMPGDGPTDEDLRTDAELTRQELAETVVALGDRLDVKTRVRIATRRRAEAVRATVSRRPAIPLGGLAALLTTLVVWLKIRHRR